MATIRLGLYLGVEPSAGGMFQYAQSMLEALATLPPKSYEVVTAYGDDRWLPILQRLGLSGFALKHAKSGLSIANTLMALRIPARTSQWLAGIVNPLVRELVSLRCDVWVFPAQESLGYQMRGRTVATIHDLMHRYEPQFPEVSSKFRYGIREHRFSNLARACSAVLVDSETGRTQVVESYGVSAAKVHPLPYVAPSFLHTTRERAGFDEYYGLPEKFFFYPAQFWQHKNHLRLLEALKQCRQTLPDVALVLSGAPAHEYEIVKAYVHELALDDCVKFVGYVPDSDLSGFYGRARSLVMPTFFGPTNIPPLEAMSCGCPVLVSGIYGMPAQCGDAALYFNPLSVDEMAAVMSRIWSDDRLARQMSDLGRARAAAWGAQQFNERFAFILARMMRGEPP